MQAFEASGVTVNDRAHLAPFVRFEMLTLMTAGAIVQLICGSSQRGRRDFSTASSSTISTRASPGRWPANTTPRTTRIITCQDERGSMDLEIDLKADLSAMDDAGNGWSLLSDARDPSRVTVGRALLAGNSLASPSCAFSRWTTMVRSTS